MDPQHLGHDVLREPEVIGIDAIGNGQKPSRQPRLDRVQPVARRCLRDLNQASLDIEVKDRPEGRSP